MNIVIPTCDNPGGLATLLGSFLSDCATPHNNNPIVTEHKITIVDSSRAPVIHSSSVRRLLPAFCVNYCYHPTRQVNTQRLYGIMACGASDDSAILLMDDDLVLRSGYVRGLRDIEKLHYVHPDRVTFGVTVDLVNEQGYDDYKVNGPPEDNHSFSIHDAEDGAYNLVFSPQTSDFSASIGHMIASKHNLLEILGKYHNHYPDDPALADDSASLELAQKFQGCVANCLRAWHIGNDNNSWKTKNFKKDLVRKIVHQELAIPVGVNHAR